jgi:hypothetical protein
MTGSQSESALGTASRETGAAVSRALGLRDVDSPPPDGRLRTENLNHPASSPEGRKSHAVAHSCDNTSACSRTVRVALSCLSGG